MATLPQMTARLARASLLLLAPQIAISLLPAQTFRITSPVDGAVVSSGRTLTVTVDAPVGAFTAVTLVGRDPIGFVGTLKAPPYQFTVEVPASTAPRTYTLKAIGATSAGQVVESDPITIDVERPDAPLQLRSEASTLSLRYVGASLPLLVRGTFADGSDLTLTYSSLTTYTSDNPAVANVTGSGLVTAAGPGSAKITIKNGGVSTTVAVSVPEPVTIFPLSVSLNPSQTQGFVYQLAMPAGTDPTVTWSIHPALGSIDGTGLYTAPSAIDSEKRVVVTATSVADPTKSASAQITLVPSKSRGRAEPGRPQ